MVNTAPRIGIVIDLKQLESLMKEYTSEFPQDLAQSLTLSLFLAWAANKQKENTNGTQTNDRTGTGNQSVQ